MNAYCPKCQKLQLIIISTAVICSVCLSIMGEHRDHLPHQDFSTQMVKIDSVVFGGTASSATTSMVHASDIGKL